LRYGIRAYNVDDVFNYKDHGVIVEEGLSSCYWDECIAAYKKYTERDDDISRHNAFSIEIIDTHVND
jgi:hypothetical protein